MITNEEAMNIMIEFISLKNKFKQTKAHSDGIAFKNYENFCLEKFNFIIRMHTSKYKNFTNYEDLNQEGYEALLKAMETYDPSLGQPYWWFHKYIQTRIARSANLHTAIRFPLKFSKQNSPFRESKIPVMFEKSKNPEKSLEDEQVQIAINNAMQSLTETQVNVISLAFGFDDEKPLSINKICKKMNMTRMICIRTINSALTKLKKNINL